MLLHYENRPKELLLLRAKRYKTGKADNPKAMTSFTAAYHKKLYAKLSFHLVL